MRIKFDEQLNYLNQQMIKMGNMIEENIQSSIRAFLNQDIETAKQLVEKDTDVDHMQKEIENICFNLLIQQQPVAKDLRAITAAMKMVTDMERIGDHAADISEVTIVMSGKKDENTMRLISKMAVSATQMLIESIDAYVQKDMKKAYEVIREDETVDSLFVEVKEALVNLIARDPKSGEQELDLLMVAKYLERIGDHATNLAEWVIYSVDNHAV